MGRLAKVTVGPTSIVTLRFASHTREESSPIIPTFLRHSQVLPLYLQSLSLVAYCMDFLCFSLIMHFYGSLKGFHPKEYGMMRQAMRAIDRRVGLGWAGSEVSRLITGSSFSKE
jgi:hypothetical protein